MKKSTKVRLLSFSAAFLVTVGGVLLDSRLMLDSNRSELEYAYRRALNDLTDYVSNMQSMLKKASFVNTASMQSTLSAKLLEQSGGAKAAMAALPFSQEKTDRISRFLSQVGDYALSLTRKSVSGGKLEEEDLQGLASLEGYAGKLTDALLGVQARLSAERAAIGRTESLLNNVDAIDTLPALDDDFDQVAEEFSEFPALLYDGPFSDHIQRREPLSLQGKAEVTPEEAARKAAGFLHCRPEDLTGPTEGGAQLAVYSFVYGDQGDDPVGTSRVNITKLGGEIAYFKKGGDIPEAKLDYEDALKEAGEALRGLGITSFRESYYVMNDNLCTINFAALAQPGDGLLSGDLMDVVCYPDLIKVTVELSQGGMVEYDASGWLMNHHDRELAAPALSAEDAAKSLSPLLTVEGSSLAVIPTPGLNEVLCWEFRCTAQDGTRVLCYLNAQSGLEEQIYLLREDDHGVLVV